MDSETQPTAVVSQPSGWATTSIVCSCLGYGSLLLAGRGDEMASIGSGIVAFLILAGLLLFGFIGACIAAARGEARRPVLVAFLLSAGPVVLAILVSMLKHA